MAGIFLGLAIFLEVAGTTFMKLSAGFTRLMPSILMGVCYALSLTCLTFALRGIEVNVAYAVWSGMGTALLALIGTLAFNESMSLAKGLSLATIVAGVVALHLSGGSH